MARGILVVLTIVVVMVAANAVLRPRS